MKTNTIEPINCEFPILSAMQAQVQLKSGAMLIDIREADEHRRENIVGAHNMPLSKLENGLPQGSQPLIFHCRSGNRTIVNAARLAAAAKGRKGFILEGGIEAWRDAGFPTKLDKSKPIELMRQVQIVAGSMVVIGTTIGVVVHPVFHGVSVFVGAGLVFAGATGFCGMAQLLARAPWNKRQITIAAT